MRWQHAYKTCYPHTASAATGPLTSKVHISVLKYPHIAARRHNINLCIFHKLRRLITCASWSCASAGRLYAGRHLVSHTLHVHHNARPGLHVVWQRDKPLLGVACRGGAWRRPEECAGNWMRHQRWIGFWMQRQGCADHAGAGRDDAFGSCTGSAPPHHAGPCWHGRSGPHLHR